MTAVVDTVVFGDDVNVNFKEKKVTVDGLARSSVAAATALDTLGTIVTVTDKKRKNELASQIEALGGKRIRVVAGEHPEPLFTETDLVVLSPGVPKLPQITAARQRGVKVISELELGWLLSNSPFIGITGTNGKSTVTTLVGLMLERSGKKVLTAGNIGTALTEHPAMLRDQDWVVVEISSFQLEEIETFRPRIAAILNITQDHLDRYRDMQEYADAKRRIVENQTDDDVLVLNHDDPLVTAMAEHAAARVLPFSRLTEIEEGVSVSRGIVTYRGDAICRVEEIKLGSASV